jgi:hypothetical protein
MINLSGEIPKVRTWLRRFNPDESDRPLTTFERSCGYPMGLLNLARQKFFQKLSNGQNKPDPSS